MASQPLRPASKDRGGILARGLVTLASSWVLLGGGLKIATGSPGDLPGILRQLPVNPGLLFSAVVAVELGVGALALLWPRLGAPLLTGLLAVFLCLLGVQVIQGEERCGCFGAALALPPLLMVAVDGAFLVALLLLRPWRASGRRWLPEPVTFFIVGALVAVPWVWTREIRQAPTAPGATGWFVLDPPAWTGRPLAETPLGGLFQGPAPTPQNADIVFYRLSCEVCAEHLEELAVLGPLRARPLYLLRLPLSDEERNDPEAQKVRILPEGPDVRLIELPAGVQWVLTPPVHVVVAGGILQGVYEGMAAREHLRDRTPGR